MEDSDSDGEATAESLERLMVRTDPQVPRRELEDDYEVLEELGRGSYGRVVLVRPHRGGSPLVLKLLGKERTERRTFLREYCVSRCAAAHGSCLRALPGAFETSSHYVFALEVAPAGDLCSLLEPGEGLPEAPVKRCAAQVASALDFLHGLALVHGDVKLDNVLLFDRQCRLVKLGDFGLTRPQGSAVGPSASALPYAAPELLALVASQTLSLEPSVDVWAFGVLLFCLATGRFPWASARGDDPDFQEFSSWQEGKPGGEVPPPAAWEVFTEEGLEMMRRVMKMDPERRSAAGEVEKYLHRPWLVATGSGEGATGGDQSALRTGSTGELEGEDGGEGSSREETSSSQSLLRTGELVGEDGGEGSSREETSSSHSLLRTGSTGELEGEDGGEGSSREETSSSQSLLRTGELVGEDGGEGSSREETSSSQSLLRTGELVGDGGGEGSSRAATSSSQFLLRTGSTGSTGEVAGDGGGEGSSREETSSSQSSLRTGSTGEVVGDGGGEGSSREETSSSQSPLRTGSTGELDGDGGGEGSSREETSSSQSLLRTGELVGDGGGEGSSREETSSSQSLLRTGSTGELEGEDGGEGSSREETSSSQSPLRTGSTGSTGEVDGDDGGEGSSRPAISSSQSPLSTGSTGELDADGARDGPSTGPSPP
ncbi:uncharacterized serine/threonine-protein kinase SBK3-like [Phaenicophaeus curvirostris]|uniref:uncharacterized serine/threonine-protein kinase SBK3-like n=1 Tax=Phaenicophaeus curvirostris TaxID=33595 RepID=UPI0037F0FAD9